MSFSESKPGMELARAMRARGLHVDWIREERSPLLRMTAYSMRRSDTGRSSIIHVTDQDLLEAADPRRHLQLQFAHLYMMLGHDEDVIAYQDELERRARA